MRRGTSLAREASAALAVLGCLAATPASAAGYQGDSDEIAATVSGETLVSGQVLLGLVPGALVTKTVRVYSEPSHTPLIFLTTFAFSESEEGQAWQGGWEEEPLVFARVADFAEAGLEEALTLPDGDTGIAVWVWGLWPDGKEEDRLVSDAEVDKDGFRFFSAAEDLAGSLTHCCGEKGAEVCLACTDADFTCTAEPACKANSE